MSGIDAGEAARRAPATAATAMMAIRVTSRPPQPDGY
jgi:hypothetical protein